MHLASSDPGDPALIDRALAVAGTIPDDERRGEALAGIAEELAMFDRSRAATLIDQALIVVRTIPDEGDRSLPLAGIARRLAAIDPVRAAGLIDQAVTAAGTITGEVGEWMPGLIAEQLADAEFRDPVLIERAVAVAGMISDEHQRNRTVAGIAVRMASTDPKDPALIERALAMADSIPYDQQPVLHIYASQPRTANARSCRWERGEIPCGLRSG